MKLLFSTGSLAATLYFWLVRANRERVSVGVYAVNGFEGALDDHGLGLWTGRLFLANRSILPTAVVTIKAELYWDGRWLPGQVGTGEASELPWNLPPSQAFAKSVTAAFNLGPEATRAQVYASHRLRFTLATVEGARVTGEIRTGEQVAAAA
jgi:hypothetical protein